MASGDPLVSLRREVGVSYQAIEDNDLQLEHHTRKKRELEANRTEIRHNCGITRKYTKVLEKDKKFLQQKLEEREKEIVTLHSKELEYERKIGKLEVKLALAGTIKQKHKEKLRTLKQKKEELVERIEAKQREVDALSKGVNKLTTKLEGVKRELSIAQGQLERKNAQFDEFQRELQLVQDQRDKLRKQLKVHEKALEEAAMQGFGSDTEHIPVTMHQIEIISIEEAGLSYAIPRSSPNCDDSTAVNSVTEQEMKPQSLGTNTGHTRVVIDGVPDLDSDEVQCKPTPTTCDSATEPLACQTDGGSDDDEGTEEIPIHTVTSL